VGDGAARTDHPLPPGSDIQPTLDHDAPLERPSRPRRIHWLDAWNGHDLEAVLGHYANDVEFNSPFAGPVPRRVPELCFTDLRVAQGGSSITLCYRSVRGLQAAETMFLGSDGKSCPCSRTTTSSSERFSAGRETPGLPTLERFPLVNRDRGSRRMMA
jgi:hypothetical protein